MATATDVGYQLEGSLLEVCSCDVLCPCWIGEDPDQGTCDSVVAYHLDKGTIRGVDVGGLTLVSAVNIPGNILEGNWRQIVYIDDNASDEQADAMLDAFTGKLGGPLADLAQLDRRAGGGRAGADLARDRRRRGHAQGGGQDRLPRCTPTRGPTAAPRRSTTRSSRRCRARRPTSAWPTARRSTSPSTATSGHTRSKNAIQSDWKLDYRGD